MIKSYGCDVCKKEITHHEFEKIKFIDSDSIRYNKYSGITVYCICKKCFEYKKIKESFCLWLI